VTKLSNVELGLFIEERETAHEKEDVTTLVGAYVGTALSNSQVFGVNPCKCTMAAIY
jgi:hypothetical protein